MKMFKEGLYAYYYKKSGWIPVRLFAVTETEKKTIVHLSCYALLFDKPEEVHISAESPLMAEHIPMNGAYFRELELVREEARYPDEEFLYKQWLEQWNDGKEHYYSAELGFILEELAKGEYD